MTHWRTPHGQFRKPTVNERVSAHVERINARHSERPLPYTTYYNYFEKLWNETASPKPFEERVQDALLSNPVPDWARPAQPIDPPPPHLSLWGFASATAAGVLAAIIALTALLLLMLVMH